MLYQMTHVIGLVRRHKVVVLFQVQQALQFDDSSVQLDVRSREIHASNAQVIQTACDELLKRDEMNERPKHSPFDANPMMKSSCPRHEK